MTDTQNKLIEQLTFIFNAERAEVICQQIVNRLEAFRAAHPELARVNSKSRVSEKDTILITYGDMVQSEGQAPLQTLGAFFRKYLKGLVSTIHILPFFPYSSDDGFSVIDYHQVNPDFGDWGDVAGLGRDFRLMFDAVINHISAQSEWFTGFLAGDPRYQDYFYIVEERFDTSQVFRPRALPLLTEFETPSGLKKVWTTFSEDQIDLNYESPDVLLEVLDVLLKYVAEGAEFIRLDAVGFIWKESGTRCLHQPQAHRIIQLMRTALDMVAPGVSLITETNVPHAENISYFGDGFNEAQMVYNFSLPPLTLHAIQTGRAEVLARWAAKLETPSKETTFFNFLASHDGVGLMPARGYLSEAELAALAERVLALGGLVSYKNNPDGTQSAYELNINYLDALGDPDNPDEDLDLVARRFLVTQSIMLALRGVPGIYFHSLFGSRNWQEGVKITGRNRTINREKLQLERLEGELSDPNSLRYQVFNGYRRLLQARRSNAAFHPMGGQQILEAGQAVLAILRTSPDEATRALCLHNLSAQPQSVKLRVEEAQSWAEIGGEVVYEAKNTSLNLTLAPYQVLWLQS